MRARPASLLRLGNIAGLILVLMLAGVGRGVVAAPDLLSGAVAGVVAPICHAGLADGGAPEGPGNPSGRDCCDDCALSAPLVIPTAPVAAAPMPVVHIVRLEAVASSNPDAAR